MIRFGIVGAGNIAKKFAKDIKAVPNAQLVAVASRTLEKAEVFAKEFNIKHKFGSYLDLAQSELVDAVYIATPHSFHKDQAILFLNNDKHVLCEKPLALNQKEVKDMIKAAKNNKKLLMEAMWARFTPATRFALKEVNSKKYGKIKHLEFSFGFTLENMESVKDLRLLNPKLAGGSLLDVGVYNISIGHLFKNDEIKTIESQATFYDTGVDLNTKTTITYKDGVILEANAAIDKDLVNNAVITLEEGTITIPDFWCATSVIVNEETYQFPYKSEGFEYEIESFCNTLINNKLENEVTSSIVGCY